MLLLNPPVANVVQNGIATGEIPLGMTVRKILLDFTGNLVDPTAQVTRIVCKLNGKIFVDLSAAQLEVINAYRGITAAATRLTLDFVEGNLAMTKGGMEVGGIGTAQGVGSFTYEITLSGFPADGTITTYRDVGPAAPLGDICAFIAVNKNFGGSGKYPWQIPFGQTVPNHRIKRLHLFTANNRITAVGVKRDSVHIYEDVPKAVAQFEQANHGRVAQSTHVCYDAIVDGDLSKVVWLGPAKNFQVDVTLSAGETVTMVQELLCRLNEI